MQSFEDLKNAVSGLDVDGVADQRNKGLLAL